MEAQIESAEARPKRGSIVGHGPSAAEIIVLRERENLLLSRTRIARELKTSANPRYLQLLSRELAVLEEKLRKLS